MFQISQQGIIAEWVYYPIIMSLSSYKHYNNYDLWYTHKTIQSTFFPQIYTPSDQIYTLEDITQRS